MHDTDPLLHPASRRSASSAGGRLAACLCALAAVACTAAPPMGTSPPSTPAGAPSPTHDPLAARSLARLVVEWGPDLPIEAFGSMWLLTPDRDEPRITRIDPATNEIVATVPVGLRPCQAYGASEDAIWACTDEGGARIDPATNEVTATVEFPTAEYFGYLPYGDGALWAPSGEITQTTELVRIDPLAAEITETYPLGFDASWISYGEDALWLTDTVGGKLWRFDPASEALTEHATALPEPGPSSVGAGSIWLSVRAEDERRQVPTEATLVRISADTGEIEAEFATGGTIQGGLIHAADDAVWVRATKPFLTRIDPRTNEMVEVIEANWAGGSVGLGFDSVWVTSSEFQMVWRLAP